MKKYAFVFANCFPFLARLDFINYVTDDELDPDKIKMLILEGGSDISPFFYGEEPVHTNATRIPTPRELKEVAKIQLAVEREIPILGICRGAQLLCCLDGGKLYQHADNHTHGNHAILMDGKEYMTNSCHHQIMIPSERAKVLAATPKALSYEKKTAFGTVFSVDPEPEIVHFPEMKALGVQGHPEWSSHGSHLTDITVQLIEEYKWN